MVVLTVISRVMVHWTRQVNRTQVRHNVRCGSLVKALAGCQYVDLFELLKQFGRRLVNGANDGASLTGKVAQQVDHLVAGMCIQTGGGFVEEHHGRIVD